MPFWNPFTSYYNFPFFPYMQIQCLNGVRIHFNTFTAFQWKMQTPTKMTWPASYRLMVFRIRNLLYVLYLLLSNVFFSRVRSTQSSVAFNSLFLLATFKFLIIKRLLFVSALIYLHLSVHLISTVLLGVIAFVFHATSFKYRKLQSWIATT